MRIQPLRQTLLLLAFSLGFLGCGSPVPSGETDAGPGANQRIILLAPNIAEMVWHLGAGERVVGVSAFTDHPPAAAELPQVMTGAGLDLEKSLTLKPALALGMKGFTSLADVRALESAGCRVELLTLDRVEDLVPAFRVLAGVLEVDAEPLLAEMESELQEYRSTTPAYRTLMIMPGTPAMAMGEGGFPGSLLTWVGAVNMIGVEQGGFPFLDEETLSTLEPEMVLLVGDGELSGAVFSAWQDKGLTPHIVRLEADHLVRPGPRTLMALEELVQALKAQGEGAL